MGKRGAAEMERYRPHFENGGGRELYGMSTKVSNIGDSIHSPPSLFHKLFYPVSVQYKRLQLQLLGSHENVEKVTYRVGQGPPPLPVRKGAKTIFFCKGVSASAPLPTHISKEEPELVGRAHQLQGSRLASA